MTKHTWTKAEMLEGLKKCMDESEVCTASDFDDLENMCSSSTVIRRFGSWKDAKDAAREDRSYRYSRKELIEQLQKCEAEKGMVTPHDFNEMDGPSASTIMNRFGSWTAGKEAAGIEDDASSNTGRKEEYEDWQILSHIRQCKARDGKATVRNMQKKENSDLVSPSVAVERFGSWSEAKAAAGLDDDRNNNSRPRVYSDDQYLELLKECEEQHGKVTQRLFNNLSNDKKDIELDISDIEGVDKVPTSGAIRKRFADDEGNNGWSQAKEMAGVGGTSRKWTNEELLEQLRVCEERYGFCSASKFAGDGDFASPETLQRRFGGWNNAKEEAGLM